MKYRELGLFQTAMIAKHISYSHKFTYRAIFPVEFEVRRRMFCFG